MMKTAVPRRYILTANYPGRKEELGYIYDEDENIWNEKWFAIMEECPAVFRQLHYWEHRTEDDMPEHLTRNSDGLQVMVAKHFTADPNVIPVRYQDFLATDGNRYYYSDFKPHGYEQAY